MTSISKNTQPGFFGMAVAMVGAGLALTFTAVPALGATTNVYTASAYGAEVKVSGVVTAGPIAPALLGACEVVPGASDTASATSISETGLLSSGVVSTSAASTANSSTASSDVLGVKLLGTLITATELKAVSTTSVNNGVLSSSAAGSVFSGLSVLGIPVGVNPAPNTTLDLPGIGTVVVNEQITTTSATKTELTVNMVHIHVTLTNLLGFKKGTEIIVASATSELKVLDGVAAVGGYGQAIQLVAPPISAGPIVYVPIPCAGTEDVLDTDSVATGNIPGVVTSGTVEATGIADVHKTEGSDVTTTATVQNLNLLSGLLGATGISSTATGTTKDGVNFDFTGGTTFASIAVANHPEITVNVAPNTKIDIAGLGKLYINRVQVYADKIKVTSVELVVNAENTLGLPIGADLTIGVAEAQLHSATIP